MTVATRSGISDNAASAISYCTFLPAIAFLLFPPYKNSPYVRFHAWQSVLIFITAFIFDIVLGSVALLTLFLGTAALAYNFQGVFVSLAGIVAGLRHPGSEGQAVQNSPSRKHCRKAFDEVVFSHHGNAGAVS
jgi:uncharacterized membrane protein